MGRSEAAHAEGIAETCTAATGICGTGGAACAIAFRMHDMIELEGRRGKLRIQLKNASASYLAMLEPGRLWEQAS